MGLRQVLLSLRFERNTKRKAYAGPQYPRLRNHFKNDRGSNARAREKTTIAIVEARTAIQNTLSHEEPEIKTNTMRITIGAQIYGRVRSFKPCMIVDFQDRLDSSPTNIAAPCESRC
jgi:hypothetical protein